MDKGCILEVIHKNNSPWQWISPCEIYDSFQKNKVYKHSHCMVSLHQARYIWFLSWLSFFSPLFGYVRGHPLYTLLPPFAIYISSLLYWWYPTYGLRRNIDMITVFIAYCMQFYNATLFKHNFFFYLFEAFAVLSYPVGWMYHKKGNTWGGIFWHGNIHILGNLGNILLYTSTYLEELSIGNQ